MKFFRNTVRNAKLIGLTTLILSIGIYANTENANQEKTGDSLTRTAQTDDVIRIPLSKNTYRTEIQPVPVPYQIPYSVTVPYVEKIPYDVTVPYMRKEEYTIEVPTTVQEAYNVEIPYQVDETYNDTIENCRMENVESCRQVPRCQTVQKCNTIPGACRDIPVPACQPVCQNVPVEVCQNVPQCVDVPQCITVPKCVTVPPACREVTDQVCKTAPNGTKTCTPIKRRQCDPPVNQCHDEQVCKNERSCTDKRVCQTKMENKCSQPACAPTRRVCDAPVQQCRAENVCHDERFCEFHPEKRCRNEVVQRTRRVTKMRIETRYRNVPSTRTETRYREVPDTRTETRYREEQRTRVETRYRTEYRTENRPVQVFDHAWNVTAEIHFPAIARLEGDEEETVLVSLEGDEKSPHIALEVQSRLFQYREAHQSNRGSVVQIDLEAELQVALNPATLKNLTTTLTQASRSAGLVISLQDRGRMLRVQSRYLITVQDRDQRSEVYRKEIIVDSKTDPILTFSLPELSVEHSYEVRVEVVRTSDFLDLPDTGKEMRFEVKAQYEAAPSAATLASLQDPRKLGEPKVSGVLSDLFIQISDATVATRWAKTQYLFKVYRQKKFLFWNDGFELIGQTSLNSPSARVGTEWINENDIQDYLESGDHIRVEIEIQRTFAPALRLSPFAMVRSLELEL